MFRNRVPRIFGHDCTRLNHGEPRRFGAAESTIELVRIYILATTFEEIKLEDNVTVGALTHAHLRTLASSRSLELRISRLPPPAVSPPPPLLGTSSFSSCPRLALARRRYDAQT